MKPDPALRLVTHLHNALQRPLFLWGIQALVLTNTIILFALILTAHLQWLPTLWPAEVNRLLFLVLFITSVVLAPIYGALSALHLYYARSKAAHKKPDTVTLWRRAIVVPTTYLLCSLWSWAWLNGHPARYFGAAIIYLFVAHQIVLILISILKAWSERRAAGPTQVAFGNRDIYRCAWLRLRCLVLGLWWKVYRKKRLSPLDRALCQAVIQGNVNNVQVFLGRGADANVTLLNELTLLCLSASHGQTEIVHCLLDAGANVNAASPLTQATALLRASGNGHDAVVRLLLDRGAAVDASTHSGMTPLIFAANKGHAQIASLLLEAQANANAVTERGMTALMFASRQGNDKVVQMLLDAGADPDARSRSGMTALRWAEKNQHPALVALLRWRQGAKDNAEPVESSVGAA